MHRTMYTFDAEDSIAEQPIYWEREEPWHGRQ